MTIVMEVPYIDLAAQHAPMKARLLEAVAKVIDHGMFILGSAVEESDTPPQVSIIFFARLPIRSTLFKVEAISWRN